MTIFSLMSIGWGCIEGVEVELWGECYNIEETTIINRFDDNISGNIPESIGLLTNLITIILPFNQLNGGIPQSIQNLSELRILDLRSNQMTGEIEIISSVNNLEGVFLSDNNFEGELPEDLGDLYNLTELEINNNSLTGNIPLSIDNLLELNELLLYNNNLNGEIPSNIGNLLNLEVL